RNINIFAGFTRDIESVSRRLEAGSHNTTLLAPLNSAITKLPRKPWEDPQDYAALGQNAYDGQSGEDRAHKNLRRFVEAHVVPESPWAEGQKVQTLGGDTVWWEEKDGKKLASLISPSLCCKLTKTSDSARRHPSFKYSQQGRQRRSLGPRRRS
ncbi:hypothetical protein KCU78_g22702, partial [Aureobasidium melanogenum]